jgi:hypothetical protein
LAVNRAMAWVERRMSIPGLNAASPTQTGH